MKNARKPPPPSDDPLDGLDAFDAILLRLDAADPRHRDRDRLIRHRGSEWADLVERYESDPAFRALVEQRFPSPSTNRNR